MSRVLGSVVAVAAVIAIALTGCGDAAQADGATAQEKGKAACHILVALDLKTPDVHFMPETDKTTTDDDGWVYSGRLAATTSGVQTYYVYACVANTDGKIVDRGVELYTG